MRGGDGFLVVYDITKRSTFDEVDLIRELMIRVKDMDDIPMVLVGNKCDLEQQRAVTKTEGQDLAKMYGAVFIEASAKERCNVEKAFELVVLEIRKRRKIVHKKSKGPKKITCSIL